jgi:hypothetical protein
MDSRTFFEMMNELYRNHYNQIADILPADREGMRLYPEGARPAVPTFVEAIRPTVNAAGWMISSVNPPKVLIERIVTSRVTVRTGEGIFHVAFRRDRDGIRSRGLEPRPGGTTGMNRYYPPRTFFALNLIHALRFVEYRITNRNVEPGGDPLAGPTLTTDDFDIWKVHPADDIVLHRDVLFVDSGAWTSEAVPAERLSLVEDWLLMDQVWRTLRRNGQD